MRTTLMFFHLLLAALPRQGDGVPREAVTLGLRVLDRVDLLHVLVGIQRILLLESTEGLDLVAQGFDRALHLSDKQVGGVPEPGVLVGQLLLVGRVDGLRLLLRDDWRLNLLEVFHSPWFSAATVCLNASRFSSAWRPAMDFYLRISST